MFLRAASLDSTPSAPPETREMALLHRSIPHQNPRLLALLKVLLSERPMAASRSALSLPVGPQGHRWCVCVAVTLGCSPDLQTPVVNGPRTPRSSQNLTSASLRPVAEGSSLGGLRMPRPQKALDQTTNLLPQLGGTAQHTAPSCLHPRLPQGFTRGEAGTLHCVPLYHQQSPEDAAQ